jgi:hypothetical protein
MRAGTRWATREIDESGQDRGVVVPVPRRGRGGGHEALGEV